MGKRLPEWFRIRYIENEETSGVSGLMRRLGLRSVCQSAHCPNRCECWSAGTASFMILGQFCTRGCPFCAVKTMREPPAPDPGEPERLAEAVESLRLRYVVITSVTRDDLADGGASHFSACVRALKRRCPKLLVETLIPDFKAEERPIMELVRSGPDVVSHNIETVERLTPKVRDGRAGYRQSLETLRLAKKGRIITKSGLMLGFGETGDEICSSMEDLRGVGVDILTIGQYLQPSRAHLEVEEYVRPERFKELEREAYSMGFRHVASGPLVRSSYKAGEPFIRKLL